MPRVANSLNSNWVFQSTTHLVTRNTNPRNRYRSRDGFWIASVLVARSLLSKLNWTVTAVPWPVWQWLQWLPPLWLYRMLLQQIHYWSHAVMAGRIFELKHGRTTATFPGLTVTAQHCNTVYQRSWEQCNTRDAVFKKKIPERLVIEHSWEWKVM